MKYLIVSLIVLSGCVGGPGRAITPLDNGHVRVDKIANGRAVYVCGNCGVFWTNPRPLHENKCRNCELD